MCVLLTDVIDNYGVYSDLKLKKYIYDLEQRFYVKDERERFGQLVNFSENRDVPYHGWFSYREGFSHTLVKELIDRSGIGPEEYVLDPLCGSGTTIVEAALNGYSGIGIDVNPVAAFLSGVKCRSYTDAEVLEIRGWRERLPKLLRQEQVTPDYMKKYEDVKGFFNDHHYQRLLAVRQVIDASREAMGDKIYDLFFCAYICVIEAVSDRKRDGNGLKTQKTRVVDVEQYFCGKLEEMIADIEQHRISGDVTSILTCGDAMKMSETVKEYSGKMNEMAPGMILYSPPYANSFDYFESYKMELILADYAADKKGIKKYRDRAVESFIGRSGQRAETREFVGRMAGEIEAAIPEKEKRTGKRDARTRKVPGMIKGYFSDMEKIIAESAAVLPQGKKCYVVVDQSAYLGRIVPTDLFLAAIGEACGFKTAEIIICRKAKTSGQQIQSYPYLRDSLRESIIAFEKR